MSRTLSLIVTAAICLQSVYSVASDTSRGAQIYAEKCLSCHGANGDGTESYEESLIGDRSINELAEIIERTMPEGEPEECAGDDAKAVAKWIHQEFYSPAAQARRKPPRREPAHLTEEQYRNAVADVFGRFTGPTRIPEKRGLSAQYFADRRTRRDKRKIERTDAVIDFDFGEGVPDQDTKNFKPEEFSIEWRGSVIAPVSGTYEFVVKSENGFRLWVNETDAEHVLIDGWVHSGDDNEHRVTIYLLGGRAYPLKLEWFKYKSKTASARLLWKRPNHTEEIIPARFLAPQSGTRTAVIVDVPFPPADRSYGYERATSISRSWDAATTNGALQIVEHVSENLRRFTKATVDQPDKLKEFCGTVAEYAFRRPLSDEQKQLYIERQFAKAPDAGAGLKRCLLAIFKSPRFLLREPTGSNDAYDVAARIAFHLQDTIPDKQLMQAAKNNKLSDRKDIRNQVRRLFRHDLTEYKLQRFFARWMRMDHVDDLSRDSELFPKFGAQIESDLRDSLELTVRDLVRNKEATLRDVFLSQDTWFNQRLRDFYGVTSGNKAGESETEPAENSAAFQRITFEPDHRSGMLSHPFLMTGFAYHTTSSPIHRGVFLSRNVLGRFLKPPAEAVTPDSPDLKPELTTRERVAAQTKPDNCATCHQMINSLGFAFENFDAVGRYRATEKEKPIDASGGYRSKSGEIARFSGVRELGEFLVDCPDVHSAFAEQLFHFCVNQPILAWGPETPEQLADRFVHSKLLIRDLVVEVVTTAAIVDNMEQASNLPK